MSKLRKVDEQTALSSLLGRINHSPYQWWYRDEEHQWKLVPLEEDILKFSITLPVGTEFRRGSKKPNDGD